MRFIPIALLAASVFAACTGEDADLSRPDPATDAGATSPLDAAGSTNDATVIGTENDSATAADVDAGDGGDSDTCIPTSKNCLDRFGERTRMVCTAPYNDCRAKPACQNGPNACTENCKAAFVACEVPYEDICVTCGRNEDVCDPSADCHSAFITPP